MKSPFVSNPDEISFDVSNLAQGTTIEHQRRFGIVFGEIGTRFGQRGRSQLKRFLLQRLQKNVEVQRHIGENSLINLLNDGNAFHGEQTIEELQHVVNQLKGGKGSMNFVSSHFITEFE